MSANASSAPVKVAVVGVGHLGKHHARLLAENPRAELIAVSDSNPETLAEAVETYGVEGCADYEQLADRIEAVSVVTPTSTHRRIAGYFLEHGVDVLVEKPISMTPQEGEELVALAEKGGRILQVGHVERFNSALKTIADLELAPRYLEAERLGGITFRSMDIGVVLDLMIHDLDLLRAFVGSPVASVTAFGGALFTPNEDIASAIIRFENGAIAHLTANRVALKQVRKFRMFSKDSYVSLDFHQAEGTVIRKNEGWDLRNLDLASIDLTRIENLTKFVFDGLLSLQRLKLDEGNPLADELDAFLTCVRDRSRPLVSGEDGVAAVSLAHRILESIGEHRW